MHIHIFNKVAVRKNYECQKYEKSPIHENADANITCDFGDGDISRSRSRFTHTRTDRRIASSIIVRLYITTEIYITLYYAYTLTNKHNGHCIYIHCICTLHL